MLKKVMQKLEIRIENKRLFFTGLSLVFLGVMMPYFFTVFNVGVFDRALKALEENQDILLLEAALRLWFLNTVRALPHYLGAFFLTDSISVEIDDHSGAVLKCVMMGIVILAVYQVIEIVHHIQYDIGVPAISMIVILILLIRIDFNMVHALKKGIVVFFLVGSFQCLDIMPALDGYGFGRGASSQMIKEIAVFMGAEASMNIGLIFVMSLMLLDFFLYAALIADENRIKNVSHEKDIKAKELLEMRMKMLQSRTYMELEQLVHDLKTPLTSILTLTGIVKFTEDKEKRNEYLNSIESSIEILNEQISEILDEQRFSKITVGDFMNGLSAQMSHMVYGDLVRIRVVNPAQWIEINQIRMYRAMINLVENAYYAVDHETGYIVCYTQKSIKNGITMAEFIVKDNGTGMTEDTIASAFESGFSMRGSSGLGLNFVRRVVENHHGMVEVESTINLGTQIHIWIPEGDTDEE